MWIVIAGDPVDGFSYTGPFDSNEAAWVWAQRYIASQYSYWIAKLGEPVWAA